MAAAAKERRLTEKTTTPGCPLSVNIGGSMRLVHSSMAPDIKCPHCGDTFDVEIDYEDCKCSVGGIVSCPSCEKKIEISVEITFTTR